MTIRLRSGIASILLLAIQSASFAADEAETRFNFATGLLIKQEYALAADEFSALLKQHPAFKQADVARYRQGEALQKAGNDEAARQTFRQLINDHPQSDRLPQAHYWLAQLLAPDTPAEAAKHYDTIVTRWPDHQLAEAAAYGVVETRFKAQDWTGAIAACNRLLERYPKSPHVSHALYTRGWAAFQSADWALATNSFDLLIRQHPDSPYLREARFKTAQALQKLGRADEALAGFTELAATADALGLDATLARAAILFERGDHHTAATVFEAASKRLDGDPRQPACLMNAGQAWLAATNYPRSTAAFAALTASHPQHPLAAPAAYWQGVAQLRSGAAQPAVATLTPLLTVAAIQETLGFDLRMLLAEAHAANKDYAAAARTYGDARRVKPAHPRAAETLAAQMAMLEQAGDLEAAEQAAAAFATAYPQHPRCGEMSFWIGEFRFRRQQFEPAAAAFQAFLKAAPTHPLSPDAHYKLGWCARAAARHQEAQAHFQTVYTVYAGHALAAESAYRAGESAETQGDRAAADAAYAKALELAPDGSYAEQASLARIAIRLGRRAGAEALDLAEAFVRQHPQSSHLAYARLYQAEAMAQLERYDDALRAFQEPAISTGDTAPDAAFGAAWCLRALGRHAEAAAAFETLAAGAHPRRAEAAYLAARAREDAGDFARARTAYAALARDGQQPVDRRDEAAYREAGCAAQANDAAGALTLLAAIAARQPPGPFAAQALYDQAWMLLEQAKTTDAEIRFKELAARFPDHTLIPDVQFRLGEIAYARNDFAAAAAAYEAALKTPGIAFASEVLYKLGWTYDQLQRPDDALNAFARLATDDPEHARAPEARYRQARLLAAAGRHAEALPLLDTITTDPFAEQATLLKAETLRATNRHREALDAYNHLLKTWPDGACRIAAQLGRGHGLRAVGAHRDALDAYAAVIDATRQEEAAQATLGQGYSHFAMQNWAEAAKAFLKVDILYGFELLKPEALDQLALTWEKAGDAEKAARYRDERRQRYPEVK